MWQSRLLDRFIYYELIWMKTLSVKVNAVIQVAKRGYIVDYMYSQLSLSRLRISKKKSGPCYSTEI